MDIDDTLVRAAWKHRRSVWSQQKPPFAESSSGQLANGETNGESRKRRRVSISDSGDIPLDPGITDYFPASFEHMFGPLPITDGSSQKDAADRFPHNVSFRAADWVKTEIPEDADGYDVVVA